ncbi:HD domain-containing phosphohydrolase [Desulfatirhabdium butyrativorans]|uniref:HD domain-containing phosphohydrolase n=1 Tax=Desulfatirhabdium butyrativorans TaxID=340467 RepID=UPI0003FBCE06|nr:HD domain-containing phosphohydrolase [Desulfatirhabdium butyrativorans]
MSLKHDHVLLLVDDEPSILHALQRVFRKERFSLLLATSGEQALRLITESERPVSLIISDQRMPQMSGAEFLEKAKNLAPEAIRFLLTGYSDIKDVISAINKGEIHRYLTKPWDDEALLVEVRQALEAYELQDENRRLADMVRQKNVELTTLMQELEHKVAERTYQLQEKSVALEQANASLERGFLDTFRLMFSLIETINPKLGSYLSFVSQLARKLGAGLGMDTIELEHLEMAGLLHDAGLLGLSRQAFEKPYEELSDGEKALYRQHPIIGQICLQPVPRLDIVGIYILYHHENYDGSGFPEKLHEEEIPLGARILHIAADYAMLLRNWPESIADIKSRYYGMTGESFIKVQSDKRDDVIVDLTQRVMLFRSGKAYDPQIVKKLVEVVNAERLKNQQKKTETIVDIRIKFLKEGMVLGKDIRTADGRLLLAREAVLNKILIGAIQKLHGDGFIGETVPIRM